MTDATVRVLITGDSANLKAAVAAAEAAVSGLGVSVSRSAQQMVHGGAQASSALAAIGTAAQNAQAITEMSRAIGQFGTSLVAGNAQFETFETQLGVMLKGTDSFATGVGRAKVRIQELTEFAEKTPFEMPEILQAEKLLSTFGFTAEGTQAKVGQSLGDLRTTIGDVASMTQGTFGEIAMWVGRFSTGGVGEAIARLTELGVTSKAELGTVGLEFTKSGELADKSAAGIDKATRALLGLMQSKFGGGMAEQSKTFDGLMSTLKDTLAGLQRRLAEPMFDSMKGALEKLLPLLAKLNPVAEAIGAAIGKLPGPVLLVAGAAGVVLPIIATLGAALAPLIMILPQLSSMFAGFGSILTSSAAAGTAGTGMLATLGGVISTLLPPLLLVGAAFIAFQTNAFGFRDTVMGVIEGLSSFVDAVMNFGTAAGMLAQVAIVTNESLGPFDDVLVALVEPVHLIVEAFQTLKEVFGFFAEGDFYTGFLGLQATFEGLLESLPLLGESFGVLAEVLGTGIVESVAALSEIDFLGIIIGWLEALTPFGEQLAAWAAGLPALILQGLAALATVAVSITAQLATWTAAFAAWATSELIPAVSAGIAGLGNAISGTLDGIDFAGLVAGALGIMQTAFFAGITNVASIIGSLGNLLFNAVVEWAPQLVAGAANVLSSLASALGNLLPVIAGFLADFIPTLHAKFFELANAFKDWVPGAAAKLGSALGNIAGTILNFILHDLVPLGIKMAGFMLDAVPTLISNLMTFMQSLVVWLATDGLGMLISAAANLATGLVRGFLDALSGQTPAIEEGMELGLGGEKGEVPKKRGAREMFAAEKVAKNEVAQAGQERAAMKEDKASAAKAARGAAKQAETIGGGAAGGAAGGAGKQSADGADKAGGAAGAATDPIQAAMTAISNVSGALSSFIDFVDKAFGFRGVPPPEIIDEIFEAASELIKRAGTLAAGVSVEAAEATSAVFQMLSAVAGALGGVIDLAEKLSKFRVPPVDIVNELEKFAILILKMADKLTTMFTGGGGLEKALAKAAISQKVAESLKTWAEFLKLIAELTGALARARFNVELGPVEAFVTRLAQFVLDITATLQEQLGPKLRIALLDARDIAETLKPWVDLIKSIAETTGALARARWPADLSQPIAFIGRLSDLVIKMLDEMRARLGFQLPLAFEDSKLIAEGLKDWTGVLKDIADASQAMAKFRPVKFDGVLEFMLGLAAITGEIRARALAVLGPGLLVALEDSKEIAGTFKAWLEPIKMVGESIAAIDALRAQAEQKTDTTLTALRDFLLDMAGVTATVVTTVKQILGPGLFVAIEDSKEVAGMLKAWIEPLVMVTGALAGIDAVRAQAEQRSDTTLTALLAFLVDLGGVTSTLYQGAAKALGQSLFSAMEDTRAIADSFKSWLEPLKMIGDAAASIDKARAFSENRADVSLKAVFAFLLEIAASTAEMVNAVAREAGAIDKQKLSVVVAQTFGAWLAPLKDLGAVVAGLNRMEQLDVTAFPRAKALLLTIATETAAMVNAVSREAGAIDKQALSVVIANTFGAWLDVLAKVRAATESIAEASDVPEAALEKAVQLLVGIATKTATMVNQVVSESDPDTKQKLSQTIAQTLGAWVDVLSKASALTREMVATEPFDPAKLDILQRLISDLFSRLRTMAGEFEGMDAATREKLVPAIQAWIGLAGGVVTLFKDAAGLDFSQVTSVSRNLSVVEQNIRLIFDSVERMASDLMPETLTAMAKLQREMSLFMDLAGGALGIIKAAATIGKELDDSTRLSSVRLGFVRDAVVLILAEVRAMAADWAAGTENMTAAAREIEMFAKAVNAALSIIKPAVEAVKALIEFTQMTGLNLGGGGQSLSPDTAEDTIGRPLDEAAAGLEGTVSPLERLREAIKAIVGLMDELSGEYELAEGKLDEARMGSIAGFSEAAGKAMGAVGAALNVLKMLAEQQGQFGSFTTTARAAVGQAIQDIVSMMGELAKGFGMGTAEGREAMAQTASFAGMLGGITGAVRDVVEMMTDIGEYMLSETNKKTKRLKNYGEMVKTAIVTQVTLMIKSLDEAVSGEGMQEALFTAHAASLKLKPVAEAIGSVFEPMQKLIDSKFVKGGPRSGKRLAKIMVEGLKTLVTALIEGLKGVTVPEGLDAGLNRIVNLTQAIIDAVNRVMGLGEIDFESFETRVGDLRKAAEILASLGVPIGEGAPPGTGGGSGAPGGGGVPGGPGMPIITPGGTPPPPPPPPPSKDILPVLPAITVTANIDNIVDDQTISRVVKLAIGEAAWQTSASPTPA